MDLSREISFSRLFGMVGRRTINTFLYVLDLTVFIMQILRSWRRRGGIFNRASRSAIVTQIIFSGVDAIPTITVLSLAVGLSVTAQLIFTVQVFAEDADVVHLLTTLIALELGSLLTAFILIGRSGSAIAVDLGNMSLNREVEGLELLGINVYDFFISPRIVGMAVSQLALAIYFSTLCIVTGVTFAAMLESTANFKFLFALASAFDPIDLMVFVIKNLMFGLVIGATACFHGLRVGISVTEVPQETQRAIVNALVLVFIMDGIFVLVR